MVLVWIIALSHSLCFLFALLSIYKNFRVHLFVCKQYELPQIPLHFVLGTCCLVPAQVPKTRFPSQRKAWNQQSWSSNWDNWQQGEKRNAIESWTKERHPERHILRITRLKILILPSQAFCWTTTIASQNANHDDVFLLNTLSVRESTWSVTDIIIAHQFYPIQQDWCFVGAPINWVVL